MNLESKALFKDLEKKIISLEREEKAFDVISNNKKLFDEVAQIIYDATKSDEFKVLYQPHIDVQGKCSGAEALFRLNVDNMFYNPFVVFCVANYYGFEENLTLKVFNTVCKDINDFKLQSSDDFLVSYNINPKLITTELCEKLMFIIKKNGIRSTNVGIELTEVNQINSETFQKLQILKDNHVKIFCDDFYAGHATQEILDLPFDTIKIDGKYITGIDSNLENQERIKKIVEICAQRNMNTIAEKVETEEECATIQKLGINKIQGYYYSKPLEKHEFLQKYKNNKQKIDKFDL